VENRRWSWRYRRPVDTELFDAKLLFSSVHTLIVHKNHHLADRSSISIRELEDVPVVVMRDSTRTYSYFRSLCRQQGFEPIVDTYVDNILLLYYLAETSHSVGISTAHLANRLARPNLRAIPLVDPVMEWNIYLIKRKGMHLSPEARQFEKLLLQHLSVLEKQPASDARFRRPGIFSLRLIHPRTHCPHAQLQRATRCEDNIFLSCDIVEARNCSGFIDGDKGGFPFGSTCDQKR
jgi:hypothetical protein